MGSAGAMPESSKAQLFQESNAGLDYDVLIVGAGLSGIFSLYKMRQLGLRARVLEAGSAEGGTWFWNRYPGARFDSESYSYIFSFSQEVLDEWNWTEHFSPQPETLKYIQFLTKKFDLKRDMQFDTRIKTAKFQQESNSWRLADADGRQYTCRYLITAIGILNEPTLPNIPGVHNYKGEAWHTARWPSHASAAALEGKRVGIIGTGATAIQTIQEIYKSVGSLTVFQRTPNWTAPLRNSKISPEEMQEIRKEYPEIFRKCLDSYSCFIHVSDTRKTLDIPEAERLAHWEELYAKPGFAKVLGIYGDIYTDREANRLYSAFNADKIRKRVKDPVVAEKLIPKCHGFGTRRTPLEGGYYEAFNEPNVRLVDVKEDPIETVTEKGIRTTSGEEHEFDILIYATGFDAVTGSFRAIEFEGVDGTKLTDVWNEGIQTYLGLTVKNFPNMFMIMGPHQMFGNIPRSIEYAVEWVADFIEFARDNGVTYAAATQDNVDMWTKHVWDCGQGLLANEVDSWMTGVNKNLAHKQKRSMTRYNGPAPGYRKRCDEVKARSYSDFILA
ncbi:phenylacetone monooxygenase [Plectosphaerella plurivora]|uniref:Phenylacetone monooxygenase n=1 Tax=Plectosphaerella plurivora TaxID=936078 RepID=A0A9P9AFP2_9PEZI|nr:phenylacetone monooxygenase [Plectosphaerella plurivora]